MYIELHKFKHLLLAYQFSKQNILKEVEVKDKRIRKTKWRAFLWKTEKNRLRKTLEKIKKLTRKTGGASLQISAQEWRMFNRLKEIWWLCLAWWNKCKQNNLDESTQARWTS